jgi:hypothetical protein
MPNPQVTKPDEIEEKTYSLKVKGIENFSGYKELNKWLFELHERLQFLEERNTANEQKIADLSSEINKNSHSQQNPPPLFSHLFMPIDNDIIKNNKNIYNQNEINLLNAVSSVNEEIVKKEKNLLIFGLEADDSNAKQKVETLFEAIDANKSNITNVIRFKKASDSNKPPPILVQLKDKSNRFGILKAAKKLSVLKDKYAGVNINLDLTTMQRDVNKKLVEEKSKLNMSRKPGDVNKFFFGIRNNSITKIHRDTSINKDNKNNSHMNNATTNINVNSTTTNKNVSNSKKSASSNINYSNSAALNHIE